MMAPLNKQLERIMEMGQGWECEYCQCTDIDHLHECDQCGTVFCDDHMIDGRCPHCDCEVQ